MNQLSLVLLTPAFPPLQGGQEAHALALATALTEQGARVRVITKRLERDYRPQETLGAVIVARLTPIGGLKAIGWSGVFGAGVFLLRMIWQLIRLRRSYHAVLVSGFNLLPLSALAAGLITRKPCVVRPESPLELQEEIGDESRSKMGLADDSALVRLARSCRRLTAAHVDCFVAISAQIEQGLSALHVEPGRIVAIPNGIDTEHFVPLDSAHRALLRKQIGLTTGQQLVVYTGRLAFSKGIMMLAEAWQEISRSHPEARLLLVGTGSSSPDSCEAELREFLQSRGLLDSVQLTGHVSDVRTWLQAADVFAFPSDSEGFGLSILEAMAVGVPMVTTRVGFVSQLPDSPACALTVKPRDRIAFREALCRLLEDEELRGTLAMNARQFVQRQYSIRSVARQYGELLSNLAVARGSSGRIASAPPAPVPPAPNDIREGI